MVSPNVPPEQSANALLPPLLGDALASSGVTASYVSHRSNVVGEGDGRPRKYVPRRGRGIVGRSKWGAVIASARMILGAQHEIRNSDLVHFHSSGFLIEVGQWLARRFRKPYVITLYGTDVSAHEPGRHARYGNVVRHASARVFYSHGLREHAIRLGLAPEPSEVIYAPVSPDFHPVDAGTRTALRRELGVADELVLLTVKRLDPVADHATLVKAMPEILRRHPTATLWLAGDGVLRPALEATCRDNGILPRVRFLGRLKNDTLAKYYSAADLFVLPSQVESWGTVMLESLACGTPVVTTDTVGGVEVHEKFPADVVVSPRGDAQLLAEAVARALTLRQRTSQAAVEKVQRDFSIAACAAQYLSVYRRALEAR
ncbi:MAG TPA: glycosyltransferase family 4 protein [Vicinamibacterales bacterium]|nr:glycosyltransferase family 4 protein [Vicinamibacterales bacterium]